MAGRKLILALAIFIAIAQVTEARRLLQADSPLAAELKSEAQYLVSASYSPGSAEAEEGGVTRFLYRNVRVPVPGPIYEEANAAAAELVDPKTPAPEKYDIALGITAAYPKYQAFAPTLDSEAKRVYDVFAAGHALEEGN